MLLGLTTTTVRGGVALLDGGDVVEETYSGDTQHAERLLPAIDALLARAGRSRHDLTAIACDVGPGSFTGVRVGLATAKGIALGLGLVLVPVRSLEAMAAAAFATAPELTLCACLVDAKRGEIFCAVYDRTLAERLEPACVAAGEIERRLAGLASLAVCGEPAAVLLPDLPRLDAPACRLPSAAFVARLGAARLATAPPLDLVEPFYLRAPDAKLPALGAC
jgi:tRNA threonylcarbamoyladenosine biosynthesis protein TsaB